MLTNKELQYVNSWANRIPMPGVEYSLEVLKEIEKCYKMHLERYKDKKYDILFSNSSELELSILDKNLCHMLGIDFNNIKGEYFNDYRKEVFGTSECNFSSYNLVELIIENMEKVAELDNDPKNTAKAINYYKSSVKCGIFNKLSDFSKFNFICIDNNREEIKAENSKNLVIASNEALIPYFVMGVVPSSQPEDNGLYVVNTLMAPQNPKEYFENQEAAIPTQMIISDNEKLTKIFATPEEKIGLLTLYSNMANRYNFSNRMNIYGDYENLLNESQKTMIKTI